MKKSIVLIFFTCLTISLMWFYSSNTEQAEAVLVQCTEVKRKNLYDYINAKGKIKEGNKRNVYPESVVKIKKVHVKIGDTISAGDPIIEVEHISHKDINLPEYSIDTSGISDVFKEYGIDIDITPATNMRIKADKSVVKSPISGVVTDLSVKEGENVSPINKLFSISDFSDLYVEAMIPEAYSAKIFAGQSAKISADAFGEETFNGKIERVNPVAKQAVSLTGSGETYIEAVISVEQVKEMLRPGLTVDTKITVETVKDAMTIPYECICQDENRREYVFVVKDDQAIIKYIITGYELENEVQIKSGLSKNDNVVLNPPETLSEGDSVIISEQ